MTNGPAKLNSPNLVWSGSVAKRFERNRHLYRPSAFKTSGMRTPDWIPVCVRASFIDDRIVGEGAERIRVEQESASTIVERIEHDTEMIVLAQLIRVASQFVRNPMFRWRRIPASGGNVDIALVVSNPDIRALSGFFTVLRRHLDQAAKGFGD